MNEHTVELLADLNLVHITYGRCIEDASLRSHLRDVYQQVGYRAGLDVLSSFAATRNVEVTAQGLREMGLALAPQHRGDSRLVAVVAPTRLGYGLTRMFSAYADPDGSVTVEICATLEAAACWLDRNRSRPPGTTLQALTGSTAQGRP